MKFDSSEDGGENPQPVTNPFPPDHPKHEAWENATFLAQEQIAIFSGEMHTKMPLETASAHSHVQHVVQAAIGVFDIRANSHSHLFPRTKEGVVAYEGLLDGIEGALLASAALNAWKRIPKPEVIAELKVGLAGRKWHWKGLMLQSLRLSREKKALEASMEKSVQAPSKTDAGPDIHQDADATGKKPENASNTPETSTSASRREMVNEFLEMCNRDPKMKISVRRKHIWMAAGHTYARQFEYWQKSDASKATDTNDRTFRRILGLNSTEFKALLQEKRILNPE